MTSTDPQPSASTSTSTYKQGHHPAVTANHKIRTAENDYAFLLPHLKPSFRILDIGCGPGSITCSLAKYVPQGSVTGVDLSGQVLEQAREGLASLTPSPTNVTFQQGDVVSGLGFEDESFDVVCCNQTLVHIPTPVEALREMRRVCKSGGGMVVCREGDWPFRAYPELEGLMIFHRYTWVMLHGAVPALPSSPSSPLSWSATHPDVAPHPPLHRSGSMVHAWARQAGFDPLRIVKKATVQVLSTPEERKFQADNMIARIEQAGHREKYVALGAREEDVDAMVRDWGLWGDHVDGWYAIVQCEVVCWK